LQKVFHFITYCPFMYTVHVLLRLTLYSCTMHVRHSTRNIAAVCQ
jgi:hypothetical protein